MGLGVGANNANVGISVGPGVGEVLGWVEGCGVGDPPITRRVTLKVVEEAALDRVITRADVSTFETRDPADTPGPHTTEPSCSPTGMTPSTDTFLSAMVVLTCTCTTVCRYVGANVGETVGAAVGEAVGDGVGEPQIYVG